MRNAQNICIILTAAVSILLPGQLFAQDDDKKDEETIAEGSSKGFNLKSEEDLMLKTKKGLHFTLPEDWPVEKKDGIVQPMSIYEYFSSKFKTVETEFAAVKQRLDAIERKGTSPDDEKKKMLKSAGEVAFSEGVDARLNMLELEVRDTKKAASDKSLEELNSSKIKDLEARIEDLQKRVLALEEKTEKQEAAQPATVRIED